MQTALASDQAVPYIFLAMPDGCDDDARLQRLADLSIEIRMLKARAQTALEEQAGSGVRPARLRSFGSPVTAASCPHCGHSAGLALLPREYRRLLTLVRCFACHRDAAALDWVTAGRDSFGAAHAPR